MATFPGTWPNPLGFKAEINLNSVWTDITQYVMLRDFVNISNMGRPDESGEIQPSQLTLTLKNDGRFTPKNTSSPYTPYIVRNCQIRISVNATSATGVAYSNYRFFGEISAWPPGYDISQRDSYVQIVASGIWRRIQMSSVPIGSCYWRYVNLLTGTSVPAAYWSMEDGSGSPNWALSEGTGTNMIPTGTPSFAADVTSFTGSNALPTMNGARLAANVSSAATPTNNVFRFALSVPAAGDSSFTSFTSIEIAKMISSSATVKLVSVSLSSAGQLSIAGFTSVTGGASVFSGTIATKVTGVPVLVSVEITPSGGSIAWAMRIIKPNAGSVLDQVSGTRATSTIAAVTQVQFNDQGRLQDSTIGQAGVWYVVPTLATAASNIGGQAGELAVTRITRLCTESNIPLTVIGSGGAAMGPQVSDLMSNVLESIEATDGGLLFETTSQFGLGYRTLASLQNQSAALTISYTSGALGAPLDPTYDDQLLHNQWTVQNTPTGYSSTAQLNSGALSVLAPPNGVGQGYATSKSINANANSQADAIATQLLLQGTVDDIRYPTVVINFQRTAAAAFFSSVPSLRPGDYFAISNLPAFLGGGTTKQLAWGYTEVIGGEPSPTWTFVINAIPELPFETSFSPGSFTVAQGAAGGVPQGSSVGSTVNGSQVGSGAIGSVQAAQTLSARSIGGVTQFIAAATPYKWTFAVTGTPADATYFGCTPAQAANIAVGDTFVNSGGFGGPFTVTSVDQVSATVTDVHYTPDASSVMSSGTVQGGTNGDQWVNTSSGNQVNSWAAGVWTPITWNATNIIQAGTITATQILAGTITASQIAAGIVLAGVVNGTTIMGATLIADGTSGEILVYSGTPAAGNLIGSWSGASGTDAQGNGYPAGLGVLIGGLILENQGSAPSGTSGASTFYSSTAGRPRYLAASSQDSILELSEVNVGIQSIGNNTSPVIASASKTIAANAFSQSSELEIDCHMSGHSGTSASNTLNVALYADGLNTGAQFTMGATAFPAVNQTFDMWVSFRLSVQTGGSSGAAHITAVGNQANSSGNRNPANSTVVGANLDAWPVDLTASHLYQVYAWWGGAASGQAMNTYRTKFAIRL